MIGAIASAQMYYVREKACLENGARVHVCVYMGLLFVFTDTPHHSCTPPCVSLLGKKNMTGRCQVQPDLSSPLAFESRINMGATFPTWRNALPGNA